MTAVCSARNAKLVQGLGADGVIDYNKGDMHEQLREAVARRGAFDLCFDTVSSLDEKVTAPTFSSESHLGPQTSSMPMLRSCRRPLGFGLPATTVAAPFYFPLVCFHGILEWIPYELGSG